MKSGIYKITNKVNGKLYVGSAMDLNGRKSQHFKALIKQRHVNSHLQRSFNKYGEENFAFSIMLYCSPEDLLFYEQRAIDAYDFKNELYNLCPTAGSLLGIKHTEETKKKVSEASKKRRHTPKTKEICRITSTGRKHTETSKKKISDSLKGRKFSEEHRRNIGLRHKGKTITEESRKKMSEATIGEKNHFYGKKHSEETRKKMREKGKGKNGCPVKAFKNGIEIGTFLSKRECASALGMKCGGKGITKVLTGKQESSLGYTFELA